ncbi:MAG: FliA/WhiG family RNA polymerase sigma factor [Planctomycetaceae bacterium]|nr:FliA/WhiG family RNA polymerase sigma factor [Planctomycetaceae bacterium]
MTVTQSTVEETAKLWEDFVQDRSNQTLRNALIERYLPLVRFHGEKLSHKLPDEVELDDLVSAGIFGLMDAIDAFDINREVKFETYCTQRIRGAMLDELRNMDWVPRLVRSRARKLTDANKALSDKFGRMPTHDELAEHLNLSPSELERMMFDANTVPTVSLNKNRFETDGSKDISEMDLVVDQKGEDPTSKMQRTDLMRLVTKGLTRNERLIIILYYYEEMTMKEVGATLDLSESRVSQMHSDIVKRLETQLEKRRPEFAVY